MSNENLINTNELHLKTFVAANQSLVRQYEFNISHALAAPDGFQKPMILVNGQSPGPLIEANIGDTIRVQVNNMMPDRSTTIHWHGINQRGSSWMDGVAGISQCGIPPGQNFTYEFVVEDQRGTYWWHAHLGVQYTDGVYGPIVIRDPDERVPETDEERIIFVSDLYHTHGSVLLESYLNSTSKWVPDESGVEPLPDNILLNGQNTYNCSVESTTYPPDPAALLPVNCTGGQLYRTSVRQGQRVRLRLINSSSFLSYWFSVDNHTLAVVELDGVEVEPIPARGVYLNVGQRASVVLAADQAPGSYYMRATLPRTCFLPYAPYSSAGLASAGYEARGVLSYSGADPDAEPVGAAGNVSNPYGVENNGVRGDVWEGCDDMPFDVPRPVREMDAVEVGERNYHYIEYAFRQAQDVNRIFINKTAYMPLQNNATLWKAVDQDFDASKEGSYHSWDFGLNQQVLLVPEADKGVQIVINSKDAMEHPWHMHGHTFQIVGWGPGPYGARPNGTRWNLRNPMRRDTVTVPAQSHVVLRFAADNPGLWALHCHVAWHMEGGMLVSIAERPADLAAMVRDMDPAVREKSMAFCEGSA
ncbi:Cupredoxin [Pestalotiopsis sp. NC0098]|nr:Cupredoxin [Pestalotiopsis sp. NC0098]